MMEMIAIVGEYISEYIIVIMIVGCSAAALLALLPTPKFLKPKNINKWENTYPYKLRDHEHKGSVPDKPTETLKPGMVHSNIMASRSYREEAAWIIEADGFVLVERAIKAKVPFKFNYTHFMKYGKLTKKQVQLRLRKHFADYDEIKHNLIFMKTRLRVKKGFEINLVPKDYYKMDEPNFFQELSADDLPARVEAME